MSSDKVLQKKRKKDKSKVNEIGGLTKIKKDSPEERSISFIINSEEKTLKIKKSSSLSSTLKSLKFDIPYYIKDGKEVILNNKTQIDNYFHSGLNCNIYNYEFYAYFNKEQFNKQYADSQINLSLNLKKLYFGIKDFCKFHLKSYTFLQFKKVNWNFCNFRDPVYNFNTINVIEIFAKKGVGISTYFFKYFQKYRNRETAVDRFIPYLIFDYQKLKTANTLNEYFFLLNFAIVNAFVIFDEYKSYATKLFNLIKKDGLINIENIIYQIIIDIRNICDYKNYYYRPTIIIDNYSFFLDTSRQSFKNKLYTQSTSIDYTLFIIYSLKEQQ